MNIFGQNSQKYSFKRCCKEFHFLGHATNYFDESMFDAAVGVNLTILLVLTTMLGLHIESNEISLQ